MKRRAVARVVATLALVFLAAVTYPGADILAFVVAHSPPPASLVYPGPSGPLPWLHVAHPGGGMPYIADPQGRLVLLHGAIPGGLLDFWSGTDNANTSPPVFYSVDPADYAGGRCPPNSSLIKVPPLCERDVAEMAAMGFNSIRLPLSWSLLEPQRGSFNFNYIARIRQVVGWAKAAGMYVIIDMHQNAWSRFVGRADSLPLPGGTHTDLWYDSGAPAWATITDGLPSEVFEGQRELNPAVFEAETNFWYNRAGIQAAYIDAVGMVTRSFASDSTVVGYSLFNEPTPGWNLPPGFEDLLLFPFYRRVIDAVTGARDGLPCPTQLPLASTCGYPSAGIRDTWQLFFMETGLLREVTDFPTHLGLPVSSYPNIVLSIHPYTHLYTPDALVLKQRPDQATYPWGGYDQTYSLAEREARAMSAALFVAEFGNDPIWDGVVLSNELAEQERHRVGFAFWTWKENCAFGGNSWGVFDPVDCTSDRSGPRAYSGCVRADRVEKLARVYPEATGDPNLNYRFDSLQGSFSLHATGRPGDQPTVVIVPANVTGAISVGGAISGEPSITRVGSARMVTVNPGSGTFTINVAAAPQAPIGCSLLSSPQ